MGAPYNPDITVMAGAQTHFKTAPCVIDALAARAASGLYGYTSSSLPRYLNAVTDWMKSERGWEIDPAFIVPTYGTLQAMCAFIRMLTKPGEGVILQTPGYVLYDRILARTGRTRIDNPLILNGDHYEMDFAGLEALMKQGHRLMLLCNPHNPIMDVWEEKDLARVAELAEQYNVTVVSDEIFAEQADIPVIPFAKICKKAATLTSLGKAFNFTGASHANAIIPDPALRAAFTRQRNEDHYGSLSPFMYTAVTAAYTKEGKDWLTALHEHMAPRIEKAIAMIEGGIPGARVTRHRAGTLIWIDLRALGISEEEIMERFSRAKAEVDPGSEYGEEGRGFVRMQLGMPDTELFPALDRVIRSIGGQTPFDNE